HDLAVPPQSLLDSPPDEPLLTLWMQQKARFTSSSSGCFSVHLLPVVQMWRAGKFYYQSTPSSGALPLMERTMNQRRRIIGRRRPGQGTMTGCCCILVSCLLMC
uniref:Uncharacterized protein n=1 Tax=Aegilops tauschii subsp. strangulata TaxID=200361 RepID=A0A453RIM7_AEGTS